MVQPKLSSLWPERVANYIWRRRPREITLPNLRHHFIFWAFHCFVCCSSTSCHSTFAFASVRTENERRTEFPSVPRQPAWARPPAGRASRRGRCTRPPPPVVFFSLNGRAGAERGRGSAVGLARLAPARLAPAGRRAPQQVDRRRPQTV